MLIALLVVLGVDLITLVFAVGVLLSRRVWVSRQHGAFKGMIRVADGDVPGLRRKWKRGFGRWVGDVLVWAKAPLLFRNQLIQADRSAAEVRAATPADKVKRLGSGPVIVGVAAGGALLEIATVAGHGNRALGHSVHDEPPARSRAGVRPSPALNPPRSRRGACRQPPLTATNTALPAIRVDVTQRRNCWRRRRRPTLPIAPRTERLG